MPQPVLIAVIILSAIAVIGIALLLYFTIISRGVLKKQTRDIIGTFEREHAILFGDIQRYISRLKAISELNLLYVDQFTKWQMKFKDVRDGNDANAQGIVNSLNDALEARHWGELKSFIPKAKKDIQEYANNVEQLKSDLEGVFKIEDEVVSLALQEKEKYRTIKQKFFNEQDDLSLVADSMNSLFKMIDSDILRADEQKEKACYQEAKDIYMNRVDDLLNKIDLLLGSLQKTCLELTTVLPDKISSLKNRYQQMVANGYPLNHILPSREIDGMDESLQKMIENVKVLNNNGISKNIETIRNRIDAYNEQFDKEEEARKVFESQYEGIYREENQVHQNFVNLSNSLDTIKTYYLLGAEDLEKFKEISQSINSVSSSKTLLDNYVHSNSAQLFTVLVEKMNSLNEMVQKAKGELDSFENYLQSLKADSQEASKLIREYFNKTREKESELRLLNVDALNKRYSSRFQEIYGIIDALYADLMKMPINVKKVQSEMADLKTKGDSLLAEVEATKTDLQNAEKSILNANRYRNDDTAMDQLVSQAEAMFANTSYKEAHNALKDVHGLE